MPTPASPEADLSSVMIATHGLSKTYGASIALRPCDLRIGKGEVYGLLGPNGAGKSTLIRLLMGFLAPSQGSASIADQDVFRQPLAVHRCVSYLPSSPKLFRTMTGRRVLQFFAGIREDGDLSKALAIADRLELDLKPWVAFMSTGMRQKLAIAVCFANGAPLLILDEPTENLDPNVRATVIELVREARTAGKTVLFSSHVLSEVEEVADRVGILCRGELVHEQKITELKRQHRIRAGLRGSLIELPEPLRASVKIQYLMDGKVQIDTPGELSLILSWLAQSSLENVRIEPIGLRAVYDRFHGARAVVTTREAVE